MYAFSALLGLTAFISSAVAAGVTGTAEGFAKSVTGGGSATGAYPSDTAQLVSWLEDDVARVILLNKNYNFIGTEGTTTESGCRPASNTCGSSGQDAINHASWCTNGNAGTGSYTISVTYDNAGVNPIKVGSNKSLVGIGSAGIITGKGLYIAGSKNIIIQNVRITNLNPQYIWGGDAIAIDNSDLVWIDHVETSLIGRQHIVLGTNGSGRVSITNNYINGYTSWSATCDNHHYWAIYLDGSNDLVTMKGNYIYYTSGRSPKVGGNTLLHAVNNYWYANSGHAFDAGSGSYIVAEGNVFQNVVSPLLAGGAGSIFTSPDTTTNAACTSYLGHACQVNAFGSSGSFTGAVTSFFSNFSGKTVATAAAASGVAASVKASAGIGHL